MVCTNCNRDIPDDSEFCPFCGSATSKAGNIAFGSANESTFGVDGTASKVSPGEGTIDPHKAVKNYLDEYKNNVLKAVGLTRREYWPKNMDSSHSGYPSYDQDRQEFYRELPVEITDDEWIAVKEVYEAQNRGSVVAGQIVRKNSYNVVASILRMFAILIYIGGFLLGFLTSGTVEYWTDSLYYALLSALPTWGTAFVSGTLMFGFSEIIRLLQVIADK